MFTATEDNLTGCIPHAVLILQGPHGEHSVHSLTEGIDLLVGSDESADLRVTGDSVSSMHCMVRVRGGRVSVRDCYSRSGTFLNGHKISEVQVEQSSVVRVGDFTLLITFNEETSDSADADADAAGPDLSQPAETVVSPSVSADTSSQSTLPVQSAPEKPNVAKTASASLTEDSKECSRIPAADSASDETALQMIRQLQFELKQARSEIELLQDQLTLSSGTPSSGAADPWQDEMLELLRAEVLELQAALAEKHGSHLPTAETSAEEQFETVDLLPREEAERLVERLECLLHELAERDEQITLLNNLLESAETANRAEQEQRQQLDSWVGDIEQRMGLKEGEWQAERERLLENLNQLRLERDQAEASALSGSTSTRLESMQRMVNGMREEMESLRNQLAQSEAECIRLKREIQESGKQDFTEEAIRISQERAELARLRHELEISGHGPRAVGESSESSLRFQALREHLKEIHEHEKQQRQEATLGNRIARLWHRLEGR